MPVRSETLRYEADGLAMEGTIFFDDAVAGIRPAILLFPDIFGFGEQFTTRAERLAQLGYAALACDLHGNGRRIDDMQEVLGIMGPVREDTDRVRARARGAYDALISHPSADPDKVVATGYCFGGTMALELARGGANLAGVVGFHSGLQTKRPEDAVNIRCKVLVCIGADDPSIPPEQRAEFEQEMRAGGVDWRMHLYGGVVHSFTRVDAESMGRPQVARYDAGADHRSWKEQLAFLNEVYGEERA